MSYLSGLGDDIVAGKYFGEEGSHDDQGVPAGVTGGDVAKFLSGQAAAGLVWNANGRTDGWQLSPAGAPPVVAAPPAADTRSALIAQYYQPAAAPVVPQAAPLVAAPPSAAPSQEPSSTNKMLLTAGLAVAGSLVVYFLTKGR